MTLISRRFPIVSHFFPSLLNLGNDANVPGRPRGKGSRYGSAGSHLLRSNVARELVGSSVRSYTRPTAYFPGFGPGHSPNLSSSSTNRTEYDPSRLSGPMGSLMEYFAEFVSHKGSQGPLSSHDGAMAPQVVGGLCHPALASDLAWFYIVKREVSR